MWDRFYKFIDRYPSWLVELISGLLTVLISSLFSNDDVVRLTIATILSIIYEKFIDRNGWNWLDIGQRSFGISSGIIIFSHVRFFR